MWVDRYPFIIPTSDVFSPSPSSHCSFLNPFKKGPSPDLQQQQQFNRYQRTTESVPSHNTTATTHLLNSPYSSKVIRDSSYAPNILTLTDQTKPFSHPSVFSHSFSRSESESIKSLPILYSAFSSMGFSLVPSSSPELSSNVLIGEYANSGFYPTGVGPECSLSGTSTADRESGMGLPLGFDILSNTGGNKNRKINFIMKF